MKEIWNAREFSKKHNVTLRTLHYYDTIGLLKPVRNVKNKYRIYDLNDDFKLKKILVLKCLGMPIKSINSFLKEVEGDKEKLINWLIDCEKRHKIDLINLQEKIDGLSKMVENFQNHVFIKWDLIKIV